MGKEGRGWSDWDERHRRQSCEGSSERSGSRASFKPRIIRMSRILGRKVLPTKYTKYTDHRIKTTCAKKLGVFSRVSWAKAIRWVVCSHEAHEGEVEEDP